MHPDVKRRLDSLEERRRNLVDRVDRLPLDRQNSRTNSKCFSPAQMLMHMALAEDSYLGHLQRNPPDSLGDKKPTRSRVFVRTLEQLQRADSRLPTMPYLRPPTHVTVIEASRRWESVRNSLWRYFDGINYPEEPFIKFNLFFGTLSCSDFLSLMEAHMHYHEVLFPGIKE